MIQTLQRRLRNREDGFTLIELMVVVMIIAILVAIAIPSFFSARKRAQDSSAKSSLQISLSDAQAIYTDNQTYPATMVADLGTEEPNLTFTDAALSTGPKDISVSITSSSGTLRDTVTLAALSKSGKCFALRHVATPGAANAGTYTLNGTLTNCDANHADVTAAAGWTNQ